MKYTPSAISYDPSELLQLKPKIRTGTFQLYKPIMKLPPEAISSLDPGNYLVIVANVAINGLSLEQVVPLQATAIKASVSQ